MSFNYKNRLQEHFQGLGSELPFYDTGRMGGQDHTPQWVCQLKLPNGRIFMSPASTSKKNAEKLAAEKAYESLAETTGFEEVNGNLVYSKPFQRRSIYIDVENQPRATLELLKMIRKIGPPSDDIIHFVMSRGCQLADRVRKEVELFDSSNLRVHVTPSLLPDAADVLIMLLVSREVDFLDIAILSNDRFAHGYVTVANAIPGTVTFHNFISQSELWAWIFD